MQKIKITFIIWLYLILDATVKKDNTCTNGKFYFLRFWTFLILGRMKRQTGWKIYLGPPLAALNPSSKAWAPNYVWQNKQDRYVRVCVCSLALKLCAYNRTNERCKILVFFLVTTQNQRQTEHGPDYNEEEEEEEKEKKKEEEAVSYTHLTLPTIYSV